jgi:hypothetical protein
MKRNFKHWWSTIPSMLKTRTITSHLHSLITKKTMACEIGNPGPSILTTKTTTLIIMYDHFHSQNTLAISSLMLNAPWTCRGPGWSSDLLPHYKGDPSYGLASPPFNSTTIQKILPCVMSSTIFRYSFVVYFKHTTTSLFNGDARTTGICRKQIFTTSHVFLNSKINAVIEEKL